MITCTDICPVKTRSCFLCLAVCAIRPLCVGPQVIIYFIFIYRPSLYSWARHVTFIPSFIYSLSFCSVFWVLIFFPFIIWWIFDFFFNKNKFFIFQQHLLDFPNSVFNNKWFTTKVLIMDHVIISDEDAWTRYYLLMIVCSCHGNSTWLSAHVYCKAVKSQDQKPLVCTVLCSFYLMFCTVHTHAHAHTHTSV